MSALSYYCQLKPTVLGHLEAYKSDFLVHDRKALRRYHGRFILGIRSTGTNLLRLTDDAPGQIKGTLVASAGFESVARAFLFDANERFFVGVSDQVLEVSRQRAEELFQTWWENHPLNPVQKQ